jgi:hypothetical protein
MTNESLMQQTRAALVGGRTVEALNIAKSRNTRNMADADLHLWWADWSA